MHTRPIRRAHSGNGQIHPEENTANHEMKIGVLVVPGAGPAKKIKQSLKMDIPAPEKARRRLRRRTRLCKAGEASVSQLNKASERGGVGRAMHVSGCGPLEEALLTGHGSVRN